MSVIIAREFRISLKKPDLIFFSKIYDGYRLQSSNAKVWLNDIIVRIEQALYRDHLSRFMPNGLMTTISCYC